MAHDCTVRRPVTIEVELLPGQVVECVGVPNACLHTEVLSHLEDCAISLLTIGL